MLGGNQPNLHEIPDEAVEEFIASHPEGGTLEQIAQVLGITRERVRQIITKALQKLSRQCKERGISPSDVPSRESVWDRLESS